ncbi:efflux RND transporter periplasmic adaptor subunit [Rhizobium sp. CSW-27]|uniref:efflux RND transporter periplasmic adaptor subunit n=1 Tax=Rhizobium sp. CSW-27 TaxID=2839985 RepID=UPI001C039841|nr:efflux RND transporter periplasmic adaptor subunit [Rhizobium sp. CSW-27]MBT9368565.1 efflux RND transporter periplasmic adaptor subunit [Rhizobium sp. CSW-27]
MKKLWTSLGIIAIGVGGAWYYRDSLPAALQIPSLRQLAAAAGLGETVPTRGDGERHAAAADEGAGTGQHRQGQGGGQQAAGQGQGPGQGRRNGGPMTVRTMAATEGTLPMDVAANGFAEAADSTTIAALQQGLVLSIAAKDGQEVKAGDLIAKLDDRTALAAVNKDKANIASDEATLAEAIAAFQRAESLMKQNAQSQQSFEQAKAARDTAAAKLEADKATLASDQVTLEHTDIRAPYDGRLGDITVSPGAYVSAGATIVTITRYDPISVAFRLPQRYLPDLHRGLTDAIAVDADPAATGGVDDRGILSFFDNTVDESSGTVLAKAEFKNDKGTLWPGQNVNVTVHFQPSGRSVIVPTVAVRPGAEGSFVYTVDEAGRVHATKVTVARANGDQTAITSGLAQGDHVVVEGQVQLADGQHVLEQFAGDRPLPVADATAVTGAVQP